MEIAHGGAEHIIMLMTQKMVVLSSLEKHTQNILYLDTKIKGDDWNEMSTGMESAFLRNRFFEIYRKGVVIN